MRKENGGRYKKMTLRDYFAAKIAGGDAAAEFPWDQDTENDILLERAKFYYRLADAMLAVRKEGK